MRTMEYLKGSFNFSHSSDSGASINLIPVKNGSFLTSSFAICIFREYEDAQVIFSYEFGGEHINGVYLRNDLKV